MSSSTAPPSPVEQLASARRGTVIEYFRGDLREAREVRCAAAQNGHEVAPEMAAALAAADLAWREQRAGRVHLFQRRLGPFSFSYLAVRR